MTVGVIVANLFANGISRVVTQLAALYCNMGWRVIVIADDEGTNDGFSLPEGVQRVCVGSPWDRSRSERIKLTIQRCGIDFVISHKYCVNPQLLESDISAVHACGRKILIHHHSVFSRCLVDADFRGRYADLNALYKMADGVIAINQVSKCFFDAIGVNSIYIPNPVARPSEYDRSKVIPYGIFWVGRLVPGKRPFDAIKVFRGVACRFPESRLHILASIEGEYAAEYERLKRFVDSDIALNGKVFFKGFCKDVRTSLRSADLMLMTSAFEGSPCALSEAMSVGVPVVCYDLPYLDRVSPANGVFPVPQGEVLAATNKIVELFEDRSRLIEVSRNAYVAEDLRSKYVLERRYLQMIDYVNRGCAFPAEEDLSEIKKVISVLNAHAQIAVDDMATLGFLRRQVFRKLKLIFSNPRIVCMMLGRMFR